MNRSMCHSFLCVTIVIFWYGLVFGGTLAVLTLEVAMVCCRVVVSLSCDYVAM